MENINEDDKKVNLIKCPLPKIIYTTINGLSTFPKKSLNTSNNSNTYYSRKINNKSPGLPSLKTNTKFSSSPNKTNYINIKMSNNLNKNNNNTKNNKNIQINKIINNKEIKKQNLKEMLNSYGLNKYYDKIIELGINDDNINNLALMNKKTLNEFISNLKMFPGHIIKMEQLFQHLKQINSFNKQLHNNLSIKNNNTNNNENNTNNVNYVTLSFNRNNNNNNIANKIMHSQSHNKYRFINPIIKLKSQKVNNFNLEIDKVKVKNKTNYSHHKNLTKNRSKKNINNNNKTNFEFPKPANPGRNILIKYFFKDLANYANNISGIINNVNNIQNMNIYNSFNKKNNNLLSNNKELEPEKKINNYPNDFKENHFSKNNSIQDKNIPDLPSINNNNNNKINVHNNKSLINSINGNNNNSQSSPILEKMNKGKIEIENKNKKNKNYNNDKLDKSKTINNYQISYNINTFMKDEYIKNNNNINNNNILQKTQYEAYKKNNKNNSFNLKLPNMMNKTDFQNSLSKSKIEQNIGMDKKEQNKNEIQDKKHINENENINVNNIKLKNEKTILKRKNKNDIPYNKKINKINNNEQKLKELKEKEKENNVIEIQNLDDNIHYEEKKQIRLREKSDNISNNNIIKKEENNNKKNINNKNINNKELKEEKKESNVNIQNNKNEIKNNNNEKINLDNNNNLSQKIEIIQNKNQNKENIPKEDNSYNLENIIYDNLRLNRSFSEGRNPNIYSFDLEFICRCLSLSLSILIETSKESPHITEINLEELSSSNIKYFFFNDIFNENINLLFDLFDKEVNKNINITQISPLDKLESILDGNDESINFDINCLKHIKKETDESLLKSEEEKEKNIEKIGRQNFKVRTGLGDIEKDIKFIDEFFSMNSRKKRVINYQYVSDISKNVLCKELSYINEIDSELNGTNNSNINNTNFFNNSNNNINDNSIKARKNLKEINNSNSIIDNEELKEIKEINNNDEENNNTFNNEMNELGIMAENNNDSINKKEIKKNISNNSINLDGDGEDINIDNNIINKKEELNQIDIGLNIDNNNISSPINNKLNNDNDNDNNNKTNEIIYNNNSINNDNNSNCNLEKNIFHNENGDKIMENSDTIIVTINKSSNNNDNKTENKDIKNIINENKIKNKEEIINKNNQNEQIIKEQKNTPEKLKNKNNEIIKEQNEEDIYESDYIIDINSIDELTYYLIKRSEIFDEDFNYLIMKIVERRYIPTPEPQTIFDFMADIIILTKMEKEVIILSLIYIERLIFNTGLLINSRNWRRILLTAMIIASKIWDDNSFENSHFSQVFANLGVGEINTLERIFLELINYKVFVKQSEYFKYLLMIKINALKYNYNGRQIIPASIKKNMKYQEFTETMQNRMRKKVTLNNSAQF